MTADQSSVVTKRSGPLFPPVLLAPPLPLSPLRLSLPLSDAFPSSRLSLSLLSSCPPHGACTGHRDECRCTTPGNFKIFTSNIALLVDARVRAGGRSDVDESRSAFALKPLVGHVGVAGEEILVDALKRSGGASQKMS